MKIRKAILTGGGRATRLYPITTTINKHLLPLANKPMIFHAIERAVEAGVEEIFINTNPGETELQKYIGDGGHWGIKIKFFEQTGGPQGIAHVVKCAEDFIGDDPFMFFLSDNIILGNLPEMVSQFEKDKLDCVLAFARVSDARQFGVPYFDESGKLIDVKEKPSDPPHNLAQTGIYLYGPKVFFEVFDKIEKSPRGEYEISDIHSYFLKNNYKVGHKEISGYWKDTGRAEDLLMANKLLLDQMIDSNFTQQGQISSSVQIEGKVKIGMSSQIGDNVKIVGPVIIAENCFLENCEVGPYVTLGTGSDIRQVKIKDSIILDGAKIDCDIKIFDSLIGKGVNLRKRKSHEEADGHKMIIGDKTIIEI